MFECFQQSPTRGDPYLFTDLSWLHERLGGQDTPRSYGLDCNLRRRLSEARVEALQAVPKAHQDFISPCKLSYSSADLFLCHVGIRPGVPLQAQDEEDLLWIRDEFHAHLTAHPKIIVHCHSPVDQASHYGNRINLDSGADYGKPLTVAVFEVGACYVLTSKGRKEILPLI